jgi:hypothetical protein
LDSGPFWTKEDLAKQKREYAEAVKDGADPLYRIRQIGAKRRMQIQTAIQMIDPRANSLPDDSHLWFMLILWAIGDEALLPEPDKPGSLAGALSGVRCGGARLALDGGAVRLSRGDWPDGEWTKVRERWLLPYAPRLRALLVALGEWAQKEGAA